MWFQTLLSIFAAWISTFKLFFSVSIYQLTSSCSCHLSTLFSHKLNRNLWQRREKQRSFINKMKRLKEFPEYLEQSDESWKRLLKLNYISSLSIKLRLILWSRVFELDFWCKFNQKPLSFIEIFTCSQISEAFLYFSSEQLTVVVIHGFRASIHAWLLFYFRILLGVTTNTINDKDETFEIIWHRDKLYYIIAKSSFQ